MPPGGERRSAAGCLGPIALVLCAALLVVFSGAGVARADSLAQKRAEADRVQADLSALDAQLERATEAYNAAAGRLAQTRRAIATNLRNLAVAEANLARARADLGAELAAAYRTGDPDALQMILAAGSLGDMIDRVSLVQRAQGRTAELVRRVIGYRLEIKRRQVLLATQRAQRQKAVDQQAQHRQQIQRGLAERAHRLASIKSDIRQILAQRAAAEAARARAAAAAAHAAIAQGAANDPGVGGSAGGTAPSGGGDGGSGGGTSGDTGDGSSGDTGGGSGAGSGGGPVSSVPPPSSTGSGAADAALSQLGVAYHWGGSSPGEGFDCSGLVMWAYGQVGISLPHNASEQHGMGTPVSRDQLEPGDIVFFYGDGHDGIYIGSGEFVHAPHTGDVVKVSSLDDYPSYNGAVRIG